jgi:hypothetical protein
VTADLNEIVQYMSVKVLTKYHIYMIMMTYRGRLLSLVIRILLHLLIASSQLKFGLGGVTTKKMTGLEIETSRCLLGG